jgi:2'-5' RNA ligase
MSSSATGTTGAAAGGRLVIGVSIAVPEPFASLIQDARAGYGDELARAIPTHVTLLPPTEVSPASLSEVEEHLTAAAAAHQPFSVLLHGSGSFRPVSPVVFVRIEAGAQECREVEASVRSGLLARELHFPYHPHVTVAQGVAEQALDRAQRELRGFHAEFKVPGFSLYCYGADEVWRPTREFLFG